MGSGSVTSVSRAHSGGPRRRLLWKGASSDLQTLSVQLLRTITRLVSLQAGHESPVCVTKSPVSLHLGTAAWAAWNWRPGGCMLPPAPRGDLCFVQPVAEVSVFFPPRASQGLSEKSGLPDVQAAAA